MCLLNVIVPISGYYTFVQIIHTFFLAPIIRSFLRVFRLSTHVYYVEIVFLRPYAIFLPDVKVLYSARMRYLNSTYKTLNC